jgi:molybdopterin synthase catalytic subunit
MAGLYRIDERSLDLSAAIRAVAGPDRGAIATFIGTTRDHHGRRPVRALEYDAYREMAESVMRDIGREVQARFGTPHVAILHRIGRLDVGEPSVIIAVAAEHRREAIAACAHAIERVKEMLPIWKKEYYTDGAAWIEGSATIPAPS